MTSWPRRQLCFRRISDKVQGVGHTVYDERVPLNTRESNLNQGEERYTTEHFH